MKRIASIFAVGAVVALTACGSERTDRRANIGGDSTQSAAETATEKSAPTDSTASSEDEGQKQDAVIAAACSPEVMAQSEAVCAAAKLGGTALVDNSDEDDIIWIF